MKTDTLTVDLNMPNYIPKALLKYQHPHPVFSPNINPTKTSQFNMGNKFNQWYLTHLLHLHPQL